ncbi:NnrS family protein [Advenella mimigardefordensis]|uniref:Putative NnrS protein n=1 Tax=Advenella mimigardefordensis (strain DSM 17166 / LMG 22922 / DPN7) TaxID=1247726 RepID=W0PDT8_ADVMD|nr:NnrS family protein [Advenella mimigardefordensis]AHG63585.1 putative NnrS protein [Advenella mimigardefordensis DPN7]
MHATTPAQPRFSLQAFLSLGFRPLYMSGAVWALISIVIWIFAPQWLTGQMGGVWWHAHEMLWGFVATIAVGFLTTASATWTGHNPIKGGALGALALCWLVARLAYLMPGRIAFGVGAVADAAFYLAAALALGRVIFKARSKRNYVLPLMILLLGASHILFVLAIAQGNTLLLTGFMRTGILCMVFIALLIARRVIPFFASRAIAGLTIPMHQRSGMVQLVACALALLGVFAGFDDLVALGAAVAGAIALYQLVQWKPGRVVGVPLLWVLYLSWFFLGAGLLLATCFFMGWHPGWLARQALYVHVIAMGGLSLMIMGMITRTALGHTGRPLQADRIMVFSYVLVVVAVLARLMALIMPSLTMPMLHLAATAWVAAFGLYLYRFVPLLVSPRPAASPAAPGVIIRPSERQS